MIKLDQNEWARLSALALTRLITVSLLGLFLWRAVPQFLHTATLTLGLTIAGEVLTLSIYLLSRRAERVSFDAISLISTAAATFYFLVVVLEPGPALVPLFISSSIQVLGILLQIWAKWTLGRSFSLLPAHKGVVKHGPYRIVRHPIYLGYFVTHVGFLLGSFAWENLYLFTALYFFQCIRMLQEEKLLRKDWLYDEYTRQVRRRFIPGVW